MSELSETDGFKPNYWPGVRIYEGFIAKPENLYKNTKKNDFKKEKRKLIWHPGGMVKTPYFQVFRGGGEIPS